ncbi:hypothetical protein SH661x_000219 [Planctomicrobium sp. SH661]|uniref:hypothetical protein n=1 Tax=Planctomicrobium sp. SH661 TaxID=3448124 RepID=UPI003F5B5407
MVRAAILCLALCVGLVRNVAYAQPEDFQGVVAGPKWTTLFQPVRAVPPVAPLPKKSKLVPLDDLELTGPKPSHPFVLGNFSTNGHWGLLNGTVGVTDGNDAALQLAWADEFELEGVIEQSGLGGCFWLVGWDEGRGYGIHNVVMKDSGSPWFISEFIRNKAVEDGTTELEKFDWKGEQSFRMTVEKKTFSLDIGRFHVFKELEMENYQPGRVILGVYDTRYGPKPIRIKSLKIRALGVDQDGSVTDKKKKD